MGRTKASILMDGVIKLKFILIGFLFGYFCFGISFIQKESEVEKKLKSASAEHRYQLLNQLAEDYLNKNKIQEAIWTYAEAGNNSLAKQLTQKLEELLSNSEIKSVTPGERKNEHYVVNFEKGLKAYHKSDPGWQDWRREIIAYKFDQLLGLNVVPVTVFRKINERKGSLQYYVRNTNPGRQYYISEYVNMQLLDFILGNLDRSSSNWLIRPGGHVVAIDHGLISKKYLKHYSEGIVDREILKKLWLLTKDDLETHLAEFANPKKIQKILRQRDRFFESIGIDWLYHESDKKLTKNEIKKLLSQENKLISLLQSPKQWQTLIPQLIGLKEFDNFIEDNTDKLPHNALRYYIAHARASAKKLSYYINHCVQELTTVE